MNRQLLGFLLAALLLTLPVGAQTANSVPGSKKEQTLYHWDEFMHYSLIGQWELAQGHGQALLKLQPDPVLLLNLAESDRYATQYRNLTLLQQNTPLKDTVTKILKLIEQGRHLRRTDTKRIITEVNRLASSTTRGRMLALERLKDSGEWAIPVMINYLRDPQKISSNSVISWAMPQIGRVAINPLVCALQQCEELNVRLIILDALAKIGYRQPLPYIQELIENPQSSPELITAAKNTFKAINAGQLADSTSAAVLFEQLAGDFYNHVPSLEVPAEQDMANIWFWDDQTGLYKEEVPRDAFDELMTMRCCEFSVALDPTRTDAIALWLSGFFRFESEGYKQPKYFGDKHPDAATYALTAGPEYLHRVLYRALENRNRPVALSAIQTLQRNSGQQSLLFELSGRQPLIDALSYPDREIRFTAALTIGQVLPRKPFKYSQFVVPILAEALQQKGQQYAIIAVAKQDQRSRLAAGLKKAGFADAVTSEFFSVAVESSRSVPSLDLVILGRDIKHPDLIESLELIQKDFRLAFCPVIILADVRTLAVDTDLAKKYPFAEAVLANTPIDEILKKAEAILARNHARWFNPSLADKFATRASVVLHELAVSENPVLPLNDAEKALIDARYDKRPEIQHSVIETLAWINSFKAQRSLADLALDEAAPLEIRLLAYTNLAVSAKQYGNLLQAEQIDAIYGRNVKGPNVDAQLRRLASQAYGSLNLPSTRISQLIISQAKVKP